MPIPSLYRILSIILLFSIIRVIEVRTSGFDSQFKSALARPHTNVSSPNKQPDEYQKPEHSTACNPLPWIQNKELALYGLEIIDVFYFSTKSGETHGFVTFRNSNSTRKAQSLVAHGSLPAFELYSRISSSKFYQKEVEYLNVYLYEIHSGNVITHQLNKVDTMRESLPLITYAPWERHFVAETRINSVLFLADSYNTVTYTFTLPQQKSVYKLAISTPYGDYFVYINGSHVTPGAQMSEQQNTKNTSCISNMIFGEFNSEFYGVGLFQYDFSGRGQYSVKANRILSSKEVEDIQKYRTDQKAHPPGLQYKSIEFTFTNFTDENLSIDCNGLISIIGNERRIIHGNFLNPAMCISDDETAITSLTLHAKEQRIVLMEFQIPPDEYNLYLRFCLGKLICSFASLPTVQHSNQTQSGSNKKVSIHWPESIDYLIPKEVGDTVQNRGYTFKLKSILKSQDALKFLCEGNNCSADFLAELSKFENYNNIDFAMLHFDISLNDHSNRVYNLKNITVRTLGKPRCFQLDADLTILANEYIKNECIVFSPKIVNGIELTNFKNALDLQGTYLSGGQISGWVRTWLPKNSRPMIIAIDLFPEYRFDDFWWVGQKDRTYFENENLYFSID
jgi:hypothetical protein